MEKEGNKFERMMRILSMLSENRWTTAQEIADNLGVNKRTVYRYINALNIPFEETGIDLVDRSREGYKLHNNHIIEKLNGIDDQFTLAAMQTSPFGQAFHKELRISREIQNKILPRIAFQNFIDDEIVNQLLSAFVMGNIVEITYLRKGKNKNYRVLPLKIVSNTGTQYLQLYDFGYEKLLNFAIDKIVKIVPHEVFTDAAFVKEKLDYIDSRWGTFVNDKDGYTADVEFEADEILYEKLVASRLHFTQVHELVDGKHIFSLKVHDLQEFARWSMKFLSHIYIRSPQAVIDVMVRDARNILQRYNGK